MTVAEVRQHFVDPYRDSKTRETLYGKWLNHRNALSALVTVHEQWLDGSYVTHKSDPGDIDLVSVIDGPQFDALAPARRLIVRSLLAGKATKAVWGIDSFPVMRYPVGHPAHAAAEAVADSWRTFWQQVRGFEDQGPLKGYLEVQP